MWQARHTKSLTTSRREKARTLADIEEKNVTLDEETVTESTGWKTNKRKAISLFKAELSRQAEDEVQTLSELSTEEVRIFREQNTRNRAELRTEVTPEERNQVQEINAKHQRATRKRLALRFLGRAIGELRFF